MLDEFGIIEMNGRIYDPAIGRFFSPDPYIQAPDNSQNFNRYSYVLNNPLKYTDPSGELPFLVPVAIGYYTGSSIYMNNGNIFSKNWWTGQDKAWKAGVSGVIVGGALGLGFSAVFGQAMGITGMSPLITTGGILNTGATTTIYNIASNALITGAINTLSTGIQTGWDTDAMYKSGLVGIAAGAIGGGIASHSHFNFRGRINISGLKAQNYVTNIINGSISRYIKSKDMGLSSHLV